ncbi:MAG: UDP-N-acetylmuramoyl-L-alanyl-D-glutamate--2,6-diaminopimelate ligase [Solirubrobacterales bacterium]|jgi:UDP-N-acetylmuramoyl-L-alanyl-D-glutamate--2,6-diaminopimelate ligase|nr:UDP-N-acetylmuramoyl-L-alanyl-D-glutamate--2,6-diaminopimelate ligase [Solirubrobacterales bacterium]
MELRELLAGADVVEIKGDAGTEISGLAYDSRGARPGTLFFAISGFTADGHEFAPLAVQAGATAVVVERELELEPFVVQAVVGDARAAMAHAAVRFYGDPTAELRVIGITGTNGKTTTAFLIRHILEKSGIRTGLLGTVKRVVGGLDEQVERTTPEAIDLQQTFRRMVDGGDRACAMEVSSHALSLNRADGIRFAVGAFTNLTQDHLDFHADMEDYFRAKRRLFAGERAERLVVNADDPYGDRLAAEFDVTTFSASGAERADLRATDLSFDASGSRFRLATADGEVEVALPLPGRFNVENALCAIASVVATGIGLGDAVAALADAERVPGRFEPIDEGQPFAVLIDYAHTPDSLENVLASARQITAADGRLICVFGCGGDRDREKRPLMGAIADRLADLAVVTSDNPRSEDPEAIIAEIREGMGEGGASIEVEPDRRAAIALALAAAGPRDTVLIAGKGHEQGQEFEHGRKIPFDDRDVTRDELHALAAVNQ